MQASRISETDLNGLGEERSESEPLTRQVVQMSAPLAHHGTRHTGSLRLACATAFIHLTERTSSGQISILSKRALLELQNLLPSRDTIQRGHYEVPCCPHYGGLEKTVHSGPPSRGAAVGNTRNTVLGGPVPTGIKLCLCHHPRSLQQPWSRERDRYPIIGSQEGQRWDS